MGMEDRWGSGKSVWEGWGRTRGGSCPPQVKGAPPFGSGTALLVVNAAPRVRVYTMLLSDKKAISVSR